MPGSHRAKGTGKGEGREEGPPSPPDLPPMSTVVGALTSVLVFNLTNPKWPEPSAQARYTGSVI